MGGRGLAEIPVDEAPPTGTLDDLTNYRGLPLQLQSQIQPSPQQPDYSFSQTPPSSTTTFSKQASFPKMSIPSPKERSQLSPTTTAPSLSFPSPTPTHAKSTTIRVIGFPPSILTALLTHFKSLAPTVDSSTLTGPNFFSLGYTTEEGAAKALEMDGSLLVSGEMISVSRVASSASVPHSSSSLFSFKSNMIQEDVSDSSDRITSPSGSGPALNGSGSGSGIGLKKRVFGELAGVREREYEDRETVGIRRAGLWTQIMNGVFGW
jgi:hypothetical protein